MKLRFCRVAVLAETLVSDDHESDHQPKIPSITMMALRERHGPDAGKPPPPGTARRRVRWVTV
jgi:hypothetical protein